MAFSVASKNAHILVAFTVLLVITRNSVQSDSDASCQKWADLSQHLTSALQFQQCVHNKTSDCTRLDCTGSIDIDEEHVPSFISNMIEVDYCFAARLNECKNPVSMDFIIQVPEKNFTQSIRIKNDEDVTLKGLNLYHSIFGTVYPVLYFQFERQLNSSVLLSVSAGLKFDTPLGTVDVASWSDTTIDLIDHQLIPAKHCDSIDSDSSDSPPSSFTGGPCHPKKYVPQPANISYTPSDTLNHTCKITVFSCGRGELCSGGQKDAVCVCDSDHELAPKKDGCIPKSRLNLPCQEIAECGVNEVCTSRPSSPTEWVCQCRPGYSLNADRQICTVGSGGDTPATPKPSSKTTTPKTTAKPKPTAAPKPSPKPSSKTTATPAHKADKQHGDSSSSDVNIPLVAGCTVGGVIIVAVIIGGVIYMRKRQGLGLSVRSDDMESSTPMLGNDDSDNGDM